MKKRLISILILAIMFVSIIPMATLKAEAIAASDIKKQVATTRKHIEQLSGNTTFFGACGAHVSFQLQSLGITSGFVGKDGKDHYNAQASDPHHKQKAECRKCVPTQYIYHWKSFFAPLSSARQRKIRLYSSFLIRNITG